LFIDNFVEGMKLEISPTAVQIAFGAKASRSIYNPI